MPYPKKAAYDSTLARRRTAVAHILRVRKETKAYKARRKLGLPLRPLELAAHRNRLRALPGYIQEAGPYLQQRIAAAKLGGLAKSEAKAAAARANGKLGGRPRKNPPAPTPTP